MEIRRAERAELVDVEAVRIATWQVAYRGLVPDAVLDQLAVTDERVGWLQERFDSGEATTFVAVDDGRVVGMAVRGPCRDEDRAGTDELYAIYVLPTHWGTGAGQELLDACRPVATVWVLADNARARAFYARNGFRAEQTKLIDLGGPLREVRYVLE